MESQIVKFTPRSVPTPAQLQADPDKAYKNDALQLLLHVPPPKKFVREHDYVKVKNEQGNKVKLQYIPVYFVKYMLTRIFSTYWYSEVIDFKQLFNSVGVQVRLHYQNPTTGEWHHQDGVGAVSVQTDAGETAANLSAIKADGVMKAFPAAESYALKNAAEKIGPIFGSELQKWDAMPFEPMMKDTNKTEDVTHTNAEPTSTGTGAAPGGLNASDFEM